MNLSESFKNRLKALSGIVSEGRPSLKDYEVYHETLSSALEEMEQSMKRRGFQIDDIDSVFFNFGVGGISYGKTKKASFEISKEGKLLRKMLHVQIYRMDSGRYELNFYIG